MDKNKKPADPKKDLFWFLGILIVLGISWLSTGGPDKPSSKQPFINPPAPIGSGETFGPTAAGQSGGQTSSQNNQGGSGSGNVSGNSVASTPIDSAEDLTKYSPLREKISIEQVISGSGRSGNNGDVDREYMRLRVSSNIKSKIQLTGLILKSSITGKEVTIGKGVNIPYTGVVNVQDPIFVAAGDTIYVNTGRSPNGISFRLNKCTGYFEQNQDFNPSLPSNCPRISDETLPQAPNNLNDKCLDFLDTISSCEASPSLPIGLSYECQNFVTQRTNYGRCVSTHRSDTDFFEGEWRVYLDRGESLWKRQRENVQLLDSNRKIIDERTY